MQQVFFLSVLIMTIAVGCSTSKFERPDFEKKIGQVKPRFEERDIQKNFEKKVNLPKPFSIAVYFKEPNVRQEDRAWRWNLKEKEAFVKKLRETVDKEYVSNVFLMGEPIEDGRDLYDVRVAASKYGADSVLVVQAATEVQREMSRWAGSYILVAPLLFVNGNRAQAYFGMSASLWDVRSEMLYLTLNSEGEEKDTYPAFWSRPDSEYIEKTKEMALNSMMTSIGDGFSALNSGKKVQ